MKKIGSMRARIMIAVMAVLAFGILSAGVTGMVCLVNQSMSDMKSSMSERVQAASNLVSSTVSHYQSLIPALTGSDEQIQTIMSADSSIVSIDTASQRSAGIEFVDDQVLITGKYSGGTATITTTNAWIGSVIYTLHTSDATEFYMFDSDGSLLANYNGKLSQEQAKNYLSCTEVQVLNVNGENRAVYAQDIIGTNWSALVICNDSEFLASSTVALLVIVGSAAIVFFIGVMMVRSIVRKIVNPVNAINAKIQDMAEGRLSTASIDVHTGDELEALANAVNHMAEHTSEMINDISRVAARIAKEDLTVEPNADYVGDYLPIREALEGIISSTSSVVRQIEESSAMVAEGSGSMSENSTTLSQAATQQAATVEELNASIVEISSNISANAESAAKAKTLADDCRTIVDQGNVKMSDMLRAMEEINETSSKIANIIKTIQDISFQTNILSLNASIEAARAGEAGKGFAVVAGEVGQLAGKTAEAAKNTTDLIKTSLAAVQNGTVMANETAEMLSKIVSETDDTAQVIDQIADASQEQADSVKQILVGMDQISTSVQMTSGSSTECAASAEELSGQAQVLLQLVQRFKLSDGKTKKPAPKPAVTAPAAPASPKPAEPSVKPSAPEKKAEKPAVIKKSEPVKKEIKPEASDPAEKPVQAVPEKAPEKPVSVSKLAGDVRSAGDGRPAPAAVKPAPAPAAVKSAAPAKTPAMSAQTGYTTPKRTIVLDDDKY